MKKIFTLPNFFTILRLFLTIMFIYLFLKEQSFLSIIILIISAITDFLDGFTARFLKQKTVIGSFLDATVDKILVITTFVVLISKNLIPWWFFTSVIVRESLVASGWIVAYQKKSPFYVKPRFLGKIAVALEMISVVIVVINTHLRDNIILNITNELFVFTTIFAFGSLLDYIYFARKFFHK
ncbi:MAG: CDP-alcohol phosphatidyltransferase family protein [Endomicrobia bacterium]|nr:CDP-alcohol phosphatidyltransferase family protein [Endomicrobiia bacterium]